MVIHTSQNGRNILHFFSGIWLKKNLTSTHLQTLAIEQTKKVHYQFSALILPPLKNTIWFVLNLITQLMHFLSRSNLPLLLTRRQARVAHSTPVTTNNTWSEHRSVHHNTLRSIGSGVSVWLAKNRQEDTTRHRPYLHKANVQIFTRVSPLQVAPDVLIVVSDNASNHVWCRYTLCPLCGYKHAGILDELVDVFLTNGVVR